MRSLAVAADGREQQRCRERMGIGIVGWSYPQTGIVATVEHEKSHNGVAYEHFLPAGPFAILPMTGNRSSLVWTEREALAPRMMTLSDAEFDAQIASRFGAHLGQTKATGPRWSYPLKFHLARAYVKPRFALAGDAAHGIHPIAGQGLNLGLKDAAALAEIVLDAARLRPRFPDSSIFCSVTRTLAPLRLVHARGCDYDAHDAPELSTTSRRCASCAISAWALSTE